MAPIWRSANPSSSARTPISVATIPPPININVNPANNAQVAHTSDELTGVDVLTDESTDKPTDDDISTCPLSTGRS